VTERLGQWLVRGGPLREALWCWVLGFLAIVAAFVVYPPAASVVATLGFLYLPRLAMDVRAEEPEDYGLHLRTWRQDLRWFLGFAALITPLYAAGFVLFQHALGSLPEELARHLSPHLGALPPFQFRLPKDFANFVLGQTLVVALPEEFFYRGYLLARLKAAWPGGPELWGVRIGRAFWVTALLFALGHLAIFQFWRLGVFFPALLFGWMREKSGSVVGAAAFHAYCNILAAVLQASFFGVG
jgi:membrane protease YdiL (CAAX protease family)